MGHTPVCESKYLDILTFEESRKQKSEDLDYDPNLWMYYPNSYCDYRYILGKVGKNPIVVIGINPSTAKPNDLDNTVKSVERISSKNGYDSYIMCNVYAQRATDPNAMDESYNNKLHKENINAYKWVFENMQTKPTIWAAWGTNIEGRSYLKDCLKDIVELSKKYDSNWICAGEISKNGHPHHPLYLPAKTVFKKFDIDEYIKKL